MKHKYIWIAVACVLLLFGLLWRWFDLKIAGAVLWMICISAAVIYFLYVVSMAIKEFNSSNTK